MDASSGMSMGFTIVWLVVLFGIMYFLMIRPQKKEQKRVQAMLSDMAVGDSVVTTSGFYGVIIDMTEDDVIVEFGNNKNCRIPMRKQAIAVNDNNKLMTGELFEIKNNCLKIVSLDGHRIAIRKMPLRKDYSDRKVVVPGKTLNEISKILSGEMDDVVSIYFTNNHILFEFDQTMVVSRLIEGEYFRIDQMLSSDYETKLSINKKEFLDCIDRATLLVREGDKKPIIIHITDNNMELKIDSAMGSMNEDIDIEKEGKDILIGFNPKFLIDALKVIDDEMIDIYLVNPKAPCFIRDEEETYTYLILPVNINQNQAR